jgi:hypothetical protein
MRNLLATIGITLAIAALVAVTSPVGSTVIAGLTFNGLD